MSHAEEYYMYGKDVLGKGLKPKPQVGGEGHYIGKIEPIEFIEANDIPFHEANAIKYCFRHKKKNGAEDIKKAIWYLNRILEVQYNESNN